MTLQSAQKIFHKLLNANQLAQNYLFFGENREKTNSFLIDLAGKIIRGGTDKKNSGSEEFDERILDGGQVGIREILDAEHFLWEKPIASKHKVLAIYNADFLTREAQNALLKISEEPPAYAVFLLSSFYPESILPTLASRFQKVHISEQAGSLPASVKTTVAASFDTPKKILPELLEKIDQEPLFLDQWLTGLMLELMKVSKKNWPRLKTILFHIRAIKQYNVNMRLQLEAILNTLNREV